MARRFELLFHKYYNSHFLSSYIPPLIPGVSFNRFWFSSTHLVASSHNLSSETSLKSPLGPMLEARPNLFKPVSGSDTPVATYNKNRLASCDNLGSSCSRHLFISSWTRPAILNLSSLKSLCCTMWRYQVSQSLHQFLPNVILLQ